MIASLLFNISFRIDGAVWRALLVAALALVAFALTRYWQSLTKYPRGVRSLLVALRGASLLLLACAFAGLSIEYEVAAPSRVLVYQTKASGAQADSRAGLSDEAVKQMTVALKAKNLEVVEQAETATAFSEQSAPYSAAIFLTDGAMLAEDARRGVERASAAAGSAPVYVLTDLQGNENQRVTLDSIALLNRPVRGVPLTVRCVVHARGLRGRATLVTIADETQVRASAQASWAADDEQQALTLEVVPKTAGWIDYSVRVEGVGGEEAATLSRSLTVYAEERRQRVLFFEGEPTWEAKFIRRALEEAELFDVDYFAQVSKIAFAGTKEQAMQENQQSEGKKQTNESGKAGEVTPEARLHSVLASAAWLNSYDCIIVGATPDAMLTGAEAGRLRDWVERRGGGLVILGGNSFAGSIVAQNGKLQSLLPAQVDAGSFRSDAQAVAGSAPVEAEKSRGGVPLTPTAAGANGALRGYLSASEGKEKSGVLTEQGLRLSSLRAGATALAVNGQAGADGTSEAGATLLAAMRYGAGRAILFAPADSWRIRTSASGEEAEKGGAFAALWQGIALWAASGAQPPVLIALSDESPAAGSNVTAEVRIRDDAYAPAKIEKLKARLQLLTEDAAQASSEDATQTASTETPAQEIAFAPDASDASLWRARFIAPERGRFILQIDYTASGKSGAAEKYFATVTTTALATGESRDTLQRLARQTGGDLYTAADLNKLSDKISALPHNQERRVPRSFHLRTWWPLALLIPLLLSCEWLIARMKAEG